MLTEFKPISFEIYFQMALYPEGVKGFHYNNDVDENGKVITYLQEDEDTFDRYVCNDVQATYVVNMYNNHKDIISQNSLYKRELIYEEKGFYTCKVDMLIPNNEDINNYLSDEEHLNTIIFDMWPSDKDGYSCLYIKDKKYVIDVSIALISDTTNNSNIEEKDYEVELNDDN
jgi:hypothetical protein